jgi:hypothetical protein
MLSLSFPFSIFILSHAVAEAQVIPFFYFILTVMLSLKLKSFPFSIFILTESCRSSSHSLYSAVIPCMQVYDKVYHVVYFTVANLRLL